jgi:acyl-CoA hydrolase
VIWPDTAPELRRGRRFAALAGAGHGHSDDLDVDAADQASKSADMGIQSCAAVIGKDAYRKRITMTTSDPVLYPLPQTDVESMRQDAARTRLDLADTVEALAARLNVRRQVFRKIRSASRRTAPAWAAGVGAASVVILARLALAGSRRARRRRWAAGGVATAVSVVTYVAIDRRHRPIRQPQRGPQSVAIESAAPVAASAPSVEPGPLAPNPAGRDVVDVLLDQHRQIDGMFAWVRSTEGVARREAFAALVEFVHRHERAEQKIVHPVLAALDGRAAQAVADRRNEEGTADRTIASLIRRGVDNHRFAADFDELHNQVRAHAAQEEAIEFPLLRARVPGDRLRTMANQVQAAEAEPW